MSVKFGIGETVINDYVHTLPKWAEWRKRRKRSGDRWIKSSEQYQKEKG